MRNGGLNDISEADLEEYARRREAEPLPLLVQRTGDVLAFFLLSLKDGDYARAELDLRRLDHACIMVALASPASAAEAAARTGLLDRALHHERGWLSATARAIILGLRSFENGDCQATTSIFEDHAVRGAATHAFLSDGGAFAARLGGFGRMKTMRRDDPGWGLDESIEAARRASAHVAIFTGAGDGREADADATWPSC